MRFVSLSAVVALVAALVAGCGRTTTAPAGVSATPVSASGQQYLLSEEPASAQTVLEAREAVKDGDEVTITGRIGGAADPWVKGRAAFSIVDPSLVPCSERPDDHCPTPWDYCCDGDVLAKSMATIKFVDDAGQTVTQDAKTLLGVKELSRVTIRGKAKRDEAGNLTVLAEGIHIKP